MQNNENKQVFAGFFVRLAAYLIDWIIISAALLAVRIPFGIASMAGADFLKQDFIFRYSLYDIILYVLEVFRGLLMVALRSQGSWRWEGPLGTPLGLVHWKRASSPVEAEPQGTSDFRLRSQGPCRLGTGESGLVLG